MNRSIFVASLLSVCVAGALAVGCAAPADSQDGSDEPVAESQNELSATASQLVGSYWSHATVSGGFARLELHANGHYTAQLDPAGKIVCVTSPCLLPESGTWSASKPSGGGLHLRVRPSGQPSRLYDAAPSGGPAPKLTLVHAGVTETLAKLGASACLDSGDCKTTEECGPRVCFMACTVNDPFCCGPSTCHAKAPAPKFCGGFAGIACASNEECVDDPTDTCDPNHGGADCGGLCQPKAAPPKG